MRDYVLVSEGNEGLFIEKAPLLGYDSLVLCYKQSNFKDLTTKIKKQLVENTDLKLYFAVLQENKSISLINQPFDILIGLGTILDSISKGITHIYNNEFGKEKDAIHQRRSGLNHTILAKCSEKNIEILTSISDLNKLKEEEKIVVLGRIKQNIVACKRAGVNYSLASFADKPEKMISKTDLNALKKVLEEK